MAKTTKTPKHYRNGSNNLDLLLDGHRAARPPRPRPSGSSLADPLVPFQVWKIRRSTVDQLKEGALEKGWSTGALVRKLLDEWAEGRAKRRARKGAAAR